MFSFGGGLGMPPLSLDLDQERTPPPPPTRLDFPEYPETDFSHLPCTDSGCNKLVQLLSQLKKPQDVSEEILQALNLKVETDIRLSDIVPGDKLSSLPPFRWPESSEEEAHSPGPTQSSGKGGLSNGYAFPSKDKYDLIKREILLENQDAFRAVARMEPRTGQPNIRVTHSRNMWTGLDSLSQYWDSSEDKYFEKEVEESSTANGDDNPEKKEVDTSTENDRNTLDPSSDDKMDIDQTSPSETENPVEGTKEMKKEQVYKGRRMGTGSQMPESLRDDAVKGFMEMVAWSFGCQIHVPTQAPRLLVKTLLFPVRHTFSVYRIPRDRQEARRGLLEGPVFLAQCRGETAFHEDEDGQDCRYAALCDLLREASGMLLFAQERAREGLAEVKPGEGKWWATEPRWGGAPNDGPVGDAEDTNDKENETKKETRGASESNGTSGTSSKRSRHSRRGTSQRKLSMAERWKLVQPGPSLWDRRLKYFRVGTAPDESFDNIFMISSLNHHFSILHLRVHPWYLAWLVSGTSDMPPGDESHAETPGWQSLVLRRTRWYDLLDPSDRVEGLDGLWALFAWLMR